MSYPLRTLIRCSSDGQHLGSVVVTRGAPIYDENQNLVGYKNRFLQVRRGKVKGKECHAFFDTLDEWRESMGVVCQTQALTLQDYLVTFLKDVVLTLIALIISMAIVSHGFRFWSWVKS